MIPSKLQSLLNLNCDHSRKQMGFLESVYFISSHEKVKPNEFPTHLFGCPTTFCVGEIVEEQSRTNIFQVSASDTESSSDDDDVYTVKFYPRADEFRPVLSIISEAGSERTHTKVQSEKAKKAKQNRRRR